MMNRMEETGFVAGCPITRPPRHRCKTLGRARLRPSRNRSECCYGENRGLTPANAQWLILDHGPRPILSILSKGVRTGQVSGPLDERQEIQKRTLDQPRPDSYLYN